MRQSRDQQRFNAFMANFMAPPNDNTYHSGAPTRNLDGYDPKTGQYAYIEKPNKPTNQAKAAAAPAPPSPQNQAYAYSNQTRSQPQKPVPHNPNVKLTVTPDGRWVRQ